MITLKFVLRTSEAVLQMLGPIYRFGNYQLNRSRTFFIVPNFAELWSRCDEIWVRISNLEDFFFCQKNLEDKFSWKKNPGNKILIRVFRIFFVIGGRSPKISVTKSISVNAGHRIFSYNNFLDDSGCSTAVELTPQEQILKRSWVQFLPVAWLFFLSISYLLCFHN